MDRLFLRIYEFLALRILEKFKPLIVAVTGTVGKTTTKDAIYNLLSKEIDVRVDRSPKSYNSDFGVPVSIFLVKESKGDMVSKFRDLLQGLATYFGNNYPDILILEIGTNSPGDMKRIASWLKIDILIYTLISDESPHLDTFKSPALYFEEKISLLKAIKNNGTLLVNTTDDKTKFIVSAVPENVRVELYTPKSLKITTEFKFVVQNGQIVSVLADASSDLQVQFIRCFGVQHQNALQIAVHVYKTIFKKPPNNSISLKYASAPGRMNLLLGKNGSYIVDDSFNSSPPALINAIHETAHAFEHLKKIAVIGDMLGLDTREKVNRREICRLLSKKYDTILFVGSTFKVEDVETNEEKYLFFTNHESAMRVLINQKLANTVILFKGAQSSRLEKIIEQILKNPLDKKFLSRQENYWN